MGAAKHRTKPVQENEETGNQQGDTLPRLLGKESPVFKLPY